MNKLKVYPIRHGNDVPRQLIVLKGRLCYRDTKHPVKSLAPYEGMEVNIIATHHLVRIADDALLARSMGA